MCRQCSDSVKTGRSGDRIPVMARFSATGQTGPAFHPASYTMGTVFFLGVKRPERGVDHPLPSSVEVKKGVELYLYSFPALSWLVVGWNLPFRNLKIDNRRDKQYGDNVMVRKSTTLQPVWHRHVTPTSAFLLCPSAATAHYTNRTSLRVDTFYTNCSQQLRLV
jgi:hypothetical protein